MLELTSKALFLWLNYAELDKISVTKQNIVLLSLHISPVRKLENYSILFPDTVKGHVYSQV
jgi:hypothetical protein